MQVHAGTVIGGSTLRNRPQVPARTSDEMLGSSSSQRSNTSDGSAQSSPMTATLRLIAARTPPFAPGEFLPARCAQWRAWELVPGAHHAPVLGEDSAARCEFPGGSDMTHGAVPASAGS